MPNKNDKKKSGKLITQNKKAYHDYFIEDTYEPALFSAVRRSKAYAPVKLISRILTARLKAGNSLHTVFMSALMKKVIYLTTNRFAQENLCFTNVK